MSDSIIQSIEKTHCENRIQQFMKTEMAGEFEDSNGHISYTINPDNQTFTMQATYGFCMAAGQRIRKDEYITFDMNFNII